MKQNKSEEKNTNVLGSPKTMSYVLFNCKFGPMLNIIAYLLNDAEAMESFPKINKCCYED